MNVIDSYLDTLFDPYPRSPRMREARAELRAMMEDKQQALLGQGLSESQAVGRVIAEFGSLEEVAPELGIGPELSGVAPQGPPLLPRARAEAYVAAVRATRHLQALGVSLFVLCPVPLLGLLALASSSTTEPSHLAVLVGLIALLVMVTAGVLVLVLRGSRLGDFEDIEEGRFTATQEIRDLAAELRREHRSGAALALGIAISLWILCAVPILVTALLSTGEDDTMPLYGVCLTLVMVAAGLWVMIRGAWGPSTAEILENESDEMPESSSNPVIRTVAVVYWPLCTAIYLAWSFISGDWGSTWIVWPVAGVLYGALWAVNSALQGAQPRSQVR